MRVLKRKWRERTCTEHSPTERERKPSRIRAGLRKKEDVLSQKILLQHEMKVVQIEWVRCVEQDILAMRQTAWFRGGRDLVRDVPELQHTDGIWGRCKYVQHML